MTVSKKILVLLAGFVWYSGGIALLVKSGSLISAALKVDSTILGVTFTILSGLLAGLVKARFLFWKACVKNLERIAALHVPRVWQFYRTPFYFMLTAMIMLGSYLSGAAQGNYVFLLLVAGLDLSISIALLTSSIAFWKIQVV